MSEERRRGGSDRRTGHRAGEPGRRRDDDAKSGAEPPARPAVSGERAAEPGAERDAFEVLMVLDRLEVGPPRVEPRRLVMPYAVTRGGKTESTELVYRWEEDVFDPADPGAENLAAMVGAQLALNYGLFTREIVFRGPFDRHDRRFLTDMARNTAREIFVKKVLEPNPFLTGDAARLAGEAARIRPADRDGYLQAELRFPDAVDEAAGGSRRGGTRFAPWSTDPARHAVLSSGGKDSLLSFGLLREMGREPEAIYVNESGRHWLTALNAYQSMAAGVPGTARVWTNCDRLFAWFLRRLPFIREDFQNVRSDEYPVRLWTVAVFLFGALPLMRKRGTGRLVIGDEHDTSRRLTFRGIPHYDGLYDQSIWFDQALTRYFRRKGWGVAQFSLLRPMAEMLIEKVLVERYPELQADQVSCHAAHKEGDRVRPCGQCEKCRRIVSMLTAFGADPARCGYTPEQAARCLKSVGEKGVHQESDDAEHLAWLLIEKGILPPDAPGLPRAREHPEILQLRFDPDRSPMHSIPADLREPLYRIVLQHARGAVRKSGRVWIPVDALADPELARPYPYEGKGRGTAESRGPAGKGGRT